MVGIYNAASRGAELIDLIFISINYALGPTIAGLCAQGKTEGLQGLVRRATRAGLLFSVPVAAVLIVFAPNFLQLYGPDFVQGRTALAILCTGHIINLCFGPASMLLIMSNNERLAVVGTGAGVAVKLILNMVLIPPFGMEGAAIATVAGNLACNGLLVVCLYRSLGMLSTVVGRVG
jgi:O-antigen/teichoic acid export membrane protein